jgi:2-hydroxy-6-oxonona-2,4-dienedioate hydrolase
MISYPLQVAGVMTRVLEAGKGDPPVVLVHGGTARADRWQRNLDPLALAGHRVLAIDLPGHGFATKGGKFDYTVGGYVAFLKAFLDVIEAKHSVLVGTSLGGHIVASLACQSPGSVHSLVLVGSAGFKPPGEEARARLRTDFMNMTREGIRQRLYRLLYDTSLVTDDLIEEEFRINNSFGAREAFERLAQYYGEARDEDAVGGRLGAVCSRIPILLVWGKEDRSIPLAVGETAHAALPGSRLVVISGAAHAPYLDKPSAFDRILNDFLVGSLGSYVAEDLTYR